MDVEELSLIGPVVDLSSVDSIHRKRITAFVNHFVIQTAGFLNRFAQSAENRLFQVDDRLQKLEASLIILESKLNSIPGLVGPKVETLPEKPQEVPVAEPVVEQGIAEQNNEVSEASNPPMEVDKPQMDESLVKFAKMLQFGVPARAVQLKMQQEGISPENQNLVLNQ